MTCVHQITDQQLASLKLVIRKGHVLLGKIRTTIEEDETTAIEEFQGALGEAEQAINEIVHAGS